MQIRRSSHLTFLLSAILFCSMTVAMVAAAPVQASASSSALEQRSAEHIVKRIGFSPEYINSLDKEALEALHEHAKTTLQEAEQELAEHRRLYGATWPARSQSLTTQKQVADELMANVQAALQKAQREDWGNDLHLAEDWGNDLRLQPPSP